MWLAGRYEHLSGVDSVLVWMLVKSGGAGASGSLTTGETQYHVRGDGEGCIDTFRQVEQKGPGNECHRMHAGAVVVFIFGCVGKDVPRGVEKKLRRKQIQIHKKRTS